jgi:hypothetical protein
MTSPSTPECAALFAPIIQQFQDRVNAFFATVSSEPDATLADWETAAHQIGQAAAAALVQAAVEQARQRRETATTPPRCPCGQVLHYKGTFPRTLQTLVGLVRLRRGYYYCRVCRQGCYLLGQALGLAPGQFSAGVQQGVCRLGAELPFERAAATWTALTRIAISPREVARLTEARGAALEAVRRTQTMRAWQGGAGVWAVALDAARVCFVDDWHEVKAGVVWWATAAGPGRGRRREVRATAQSYMVYTGSMERAGERLYAEALRRGIDPATERVVCLGDGAPSIWQQFATHFAQRVEVLDWYHALEHLWAAGKGVFGEGTAAAQAWVAAREAELWAGQVGAVQAALRAAATGPGGAAAAAQEHYFATNAARMDYAAYRAAGYPIGSGVVESAGKRVVGARAKGAGMRWSADGVQAVLTLRAELLSGRGEASWPETEPLSNAA